MPYLKQIIHEMGKKESTVELADDLRIALDEGKVDYLYFRQGFGADGNLLAPELRQFDIR